MDPEFSFEAKVPVPWRERLKEYRYRFLPPLTFLATIAVAACLWRAYIVPDSVPGAIPLETADTLAEGCSASSGNCSTDESCCDNEPIDP